MTVNFNWDCSKNMGQLFVAQSIIGAVELIVHGYTYGKENHWTLMYCQLTHVTTLGMEYLPVYKIVLGKDLFSLQDCLQGLEFYYCLLAYAKMEELAESPDWRPTQTIAEDYYG